MFFTGADSLNMDAKGRLTMPTVHRDALMQLCEGHLYITLHWRVKCLQLYPLPKWEQVRNELINKPNVDQVSQMMSRLVLGHAKPVSFDSNNRILIPPKLRETVGLEKEILLMGMGEKFELWNEREFYNLSTSWYENSNELSYDEIPEHLREMAQ